MNKYSKSARKFLKECTREEFEEAIYNAKLTPLQEEIIREHILLDKTVCAIALAKNISESCIKKNLQCTYMKLTRCFMQTLYVENSEIISYGSEKNVC